MVAEAILLKTLLICGVVFGVLGVIGHFTNKAIDEEAEWIDCNGEKINDY